MPEIGLEQFVCDQGGPAKICLMQRIPAAGAGEQISVMAYGAKCDGSTDDAATINAALTAAGAVEPATVVLPSSVCKVDSTISIPPNVTLLGPGMRSGGLAVGAINISPIIKLGGASSSISNLYINAGAAGANTSGWAISGGDSLTPNALLTNVYVQSPCGGFDLSGDYFVANDVFLNRVQNASAQSGCEGVRVGHLTNSGQSVGDVLFAVNIYGTNSSLTAPDVGIDIQDAGGINIIASSAQETRIGTRLKPGADPNGNPQAILWPTITASYLGDTSFTDSLLVDTGNASASVLGLQCEQCWTGSASVNNALIRNTAGGKVSGMHFVGLRSYGASAPTTGAPGNNIEIDTGVTDFTLDDSTICQYTNSGITVVSGPSDIAIRNTSVHPSCDGNTSRGNTGIVLNSNANTRIQNVDLTGNDTPFRSLPSGDSDVEGVTGLGAIPTVAAASTISLSTIAPIWNVSGQTPISMIDGFWNNRRVSLVASAQAIPLIAGGNICAPATAAPGVPISGYYDGAASCWRFNSAEPLK